jgi:outer membrane immunogenic protein
MHLYLIAHHFRESVGESVRGTMKKLLLGTAMSVLMVASAAAADMMPAYTKAPPPAPMMPMWTGFYLGIQGGTGWGTSQSTETAFQALPAGAVVAAFPPGASQSSYGLNGFHGGGTVGLNWQTGPVVWGVEGDISGADINGSGDCSTVFVFFSGCRTKMTGFSTLAGRLGISIDHALVYIKAGGAWAHFDHSVVSTGPFTASVGDNRSGFDLGMGVEYAFWHNWSAKIEYNYMDFGTRNLTYTSVTAAGVPAFNTFVDDKERIHVIKAGVNYRFNWWGGEGY